MRWGANYHTIECAMAITPSEAAVSLRAVVTLVTELSSATEFSNLERVL